MTYQLDYLKTMPEVFADALLGGLDRKIYNYKIDGKWKSYTYRDVSEHIQTIGFGLRALGLREGDKVALLSENRPEWSMVDWTCAHFNMVSVPIYQTSIPRQIEYILNHAECKVLFVSNKEQAEKVIPMKSKLRHLKYLIYMDEPDYRENWILSFSELLKKGDMEKENSSISMQDIAQKIQPDDLWSIIYTSGTSGDPKGVMISHFNIAANVQQSQAQIGFKKNKRWLSFLPLSHSFERVTSLFSFWVGAEIYYAESIAKVSDNLKEVRPQYMTTVPLLLEKIYSAVLEQVNSGSAIKQKIFYWAKQVGQEAVQKFLADNKIPTGLIGAQYALARRLVFGTISKVFGAEFIQCVSGGAPLSAEIGAFFLAAGIRIIEGYGLTELSPVTHVNDNNHIKFGMVGKALPDVQTKIMEDGEILLKGPNLMLGYYKNEEETKASIDEDGWFHTGDIGYLDEEGYLKITDRKKNIIVTAGGKNIAPVLVEREITASKYIDQAVVLGDRQKYLIAILVPNFEFFKKWGLQQDPPLEFKDYSDLVKSRDVEKLIRQELDLHQQGLARYEQIKHFLLAPLPFSIEGGELTASLKIKRNEVIRKYQADINELYKN